MPKRPRLYTRLTRAAAGLGSYASLWQGSDHLLQVESTGYTESYQRFYFRDIQGLIVSPSSRSLYFNVIAGALTAVSGVPLFYLLATDRNPAVAPFVFVPALIVLVINLLKGPSCRVELVTAVQTVRLRSLRRRRTLAKVLRRIEPLIAAAQADLAPSTSVEPAEARSSASPPPSLPDEPAPSSAA